ncbi:MAG: glutamate racemase [Halanaerobium sp. 4-GBenrich]|uniref:Glutamate racemase n=1 Tax=Halanaerobium congolense TaxID=54121 RepID=A0A1G7G047_9FIRM|nr:glutamate racemase [Halanaerobium congolense]KXS48786.1 MAG: glutamate racemase [Halanaerobium sp. T82-1]ODS50036.1 MAG: glutamate racemase [Halanaerobium sp. 4-GBenrich]OEG62594.1 MAG: glutamate racemase [Halanaerobium sp. MDAL1]PTX16740.1 glutamate racemase [Halanaerobium congolense]PXV64342.1 glutamate racemase [Halanaerobium congolense]
MEASNRAIGLLDSGVGGLTVAREIFKLMPEENIIYYGDTLHLPYGPKDLNLVREYVEEIISYLIKEKKVKAVVIACNTATSAALDYVKQKFEVPIFGMIQSAAVRAVELSRNKKIAIIGTEGTVKSNAYQNVILEIDSEVKLFAKACPKFVNLVEEGKFDGVEVEKTAHDYLDFLIEAEVDSLILGCTHFPYLTPILSKIMGDKLRLINPAHEMALEVRENLSNLALLKKNNLKSSNKFIVSDKEKISKRFLKYGRQFLKLNELKFEEKNIFINE